MSRPTTLALDPAQIARPCRDRSADAAEHPADGAVAESVERVGEVVIYSRTRTQCGRPALSVQRRGRGS